jgi:two-component system chemotaxis response regulator CheB
MHVGKIRALVVDDSVVMRRVVRDVLSSDPEIEVIAVAADGRIAMAKIEQNLPDIVILDMEMPEMDGLETLQALRRSHPHLPVIMFSVVTERGAVATLDALAAGAADYVTKPVNVSSFEESKERIREQLIPKIKALALCHRAPLLGAAGGNAVAGAAKAWTRVQAANRSGTGPVEVVVIGSSTGGPNALAEIIPLLPRTFPAPILIVQHMPPTFTQFLAQRLTQHSSLPVREGREGEDITPGRIIVAPGDFHMTVGEDRQFPKIKLHQGAQENSCRPSVDVLFRSVAAVYGSAVLAVVLTGMGQDGLIGCERIRDAGGEIVAQDEASSVVWGMPGAVCRAGLADAVLPLTEMAGEILRRTTAGHEATALAAAQ